MCIQNNNLSMILDQNNPVTTMLQYIRKSEESIGNYLV
jgi:hypothetical protein